MRWLLLIAILGGCSSCTKQDEPATVPLHDSPSVTATKATAPTPKVYLSSPQGELAIGVEIVATEAKIERGLMFREHLPPDQGMLFLMSKDQAWAFWMRNTLIPLDIVFITADRTIAGIVANAEPRTDTLRQVDNPSRYVLEVNGGWCAAHQVIAGGKVRFEGVVER